jgi:type I pantothenate kinase
MPESAREPENFDPYLRFSESEWSELRASTTLPLTEEELQGLRGINDRLSLREVESFYLPLSRLLNLHVAATQGLHRATDAFLRQTSAKMPYVIGVAGSVAVGKSTTARVLQALLARWPDHPRVALVTTDGFLHPNRVLLERGLMNRKGFPESYDVRRLLRFMIELKSGKEEVRAPVYSHTAYDILPDQEEVVQRPDILILEGLNVLQARTHPERTGPQIFVSDFFDFSIYVDAQEEQIQHWYVERFLKLRDTAFQSPQSYFHRYARLTEQEATETALRIWREINGLNLHENIAPTRTRADLILEKGADHAVRGVLLRKL